MPKTANTDAFSLIRIGTFTAELERLHLWGTDEEIDREFNSVCRSIWGYTLDDFDDDCLSKEDHAWLDQLTARQAYRYAAQRVTTLATTPMEKLFPTGGGSFG
jgi:hypothetical protein